MNDIQQNKNVPVFYHVPKNAGTYTISLIFNYLRYYLTDFLKVKWRYPTYVTPRNIVIRKNNLEMARIVGHDPNNFCGVCELFQKGEPHDETHYFIELEDLNESILLNVNIFAVIIEADGFRIHSEICKNFNKYNLKKFMILRDPVKRAVSFFDYINSDKAKHEPTYGIIPNKFSEYAKSAYTEDSWLIRQFTKVQDSVGITLKNYVDVFHILKKFKICDIKNTNKFIDDIFKKYMNLNLTEKQKQQKNGRIIYNSKSKSSTIIDEESHKLLQQRMKYDIELYNKLLSC